MKTHFKGQAITIQKQPTPKPNQVWEDESGKLIKVTSIVNETMAYCEDEEGNRWGSGFGWFDGISYRYVGKLNN